MGDRVDDGVLACFGYPQAHKMRLRIHFGRECRLLQMRIGIATGLVLVGDLIGTGPACSRRPAAGPRLGPAPPDAGRAGAVVI